MPAPRIPTTIDERTQSQKKARTNGESDDDWRDIGTPYSVNENTALADELDLKNSELEQLSWEADTVESNDGLIYAYLVTFTDGPAEILQKIDLDDFNTIRVSANAFHQ